MDDSSKYEVMNDYELINNSKKIIQEIREILNLSKETVLMLLDKYNWNEEKLFENYFISDNESQTLPINDDPFECPICMDNFNPHEMTSLTCGHNYCINCWQQFLQTSIYNNINCTLTSCPFPKCKTIVPRHFFKKFVAFEDYEKYKKHRLRFLVENNQNIIECPSPTCTYKIYSSNKNRINPVICACGFKFCFKCNDYDIGNHLPTKCDTVIKWFAQNQNENRNIRWMLQNTKKCPDCLSPIEKNGGCLHMVCKKCKHHFCWLCKESWKTHDSDTGGFYKCNRYENNKDQYNDIEFDKTQYTKNDLQRFMFYLHRYESYSDSLKYLKQNISVIDDKASQMIDKFGDTKVTQLIHIKHAHDQIIRNTNTLKWSYVYGYYINKDDILTLNLFEHLQESLEKYNNTLTDEFEKHIDEIYNFNLYFKRIVNLTKITRQFNDNFINGVLEGLH